MSTRSGIGYDVHRLVGGRRLVLGGVEIEHDAGLEGHSDADVLAHAVIDALLGAAALGDIGALYPDDDPQHAGADSIELLRDATGRVRAAGFEPLAVDVTVIAELPRLTPHRDAMVARLADALGLQPGSVNVKATTNERIGSIGRGEGIAALAVATVQLRE